MDLDTRSKLLEIATELFARKGFSGVSVREITKLARTNVSAVSYYFNGKEGIYQAVLEEQLSPILQVLQNVQAAKDSSATQRLMLFANQIAEVHAKRPYWSRIMSSEVTNPTEYGGPIIERHISQIHQYFWTVLQEGITQGEFRDDLDIPYSTISFIGILNFYFIAKPLIAKFTPLSQAANFEYVAHAFDIYLQGIAKGETR